VHCINKCRQRRQKDTFILRFIFHRIQKWHQVAGDDGLIQETVKKYSRVDQIWLSMPKIVASSSLYFEPYLSAKTAHLFDAWKSSKLYLRIQFLHNIKHCVSTINFA